MAHNHVSCDENIWLFERIYMFVCVYHPVFILCILGYIQTMADKTKGASECSKRPLSLLLHTHMHACACTHIHTHTHTECRNKAEASMVHHASFTLHLLWSTEKKQTKVCHSIWASLYLFLQLSHSASALHVLNSSSLSPQYNKKKLPKQTPMFP